MAGRVVVVTGASAGVGRAVAREFARRGDHVGLIARGAAGLEAARREAQALGVKAAAFQADVADPEQIERAAEAFERQLGPIDVWVNNAMVSVFSPVKDLNPDEVRRVTEVTYLGSVYGTMAALKRMMKRDRGVIVQVGSALAYRSIPLQAAYCGAKRALAGFLGSLRCELLHDKSGVRVAIVNLPALNTPQFEWVRSRLPGHPQPVPPIFEPEVAARAVYWASRHPRRELTVGMSTELAVQGNKLAPGLIDRYLSRTGYDSQQTDEPADPGRPDNLWDPVDQENDHGAHGTFGARSRRRSPQLWATTHRGVLVSLTGLAVAAAFGILRA